MSTHRGLAPLDKNQKALRSRSRTYLKGFTMVEVLVYLGLFSILIGGTVTAVFSIFEGSDRNQVAIMVQEEGTFLLAKINWALTGIDSSNVSNPGTLSVVKYEGTGTTNITITVNGTDLQIQQDANLAMNLNNTNVEVSNLVFTRTVDTGSGIQPESIKAEFTLTARTPNGMALERQFSTVAYVRQ